MKQILILGNHQLSEFILGSFLGKLFFTFGGGGGNIKGWNVVAFDHIEIIISLSQLSPNFRKFPKATMFHITLMEHVHIMNMYKNQEI